MTERPFRRSPPSTSLSIRFRGQLSDADKGAKINRNWLRRGQFSTHGLLFGSATQGSETDMSRDFASIAEIFGLKTLNGIKIWKSQLADSYRHTSLGEADINRLSQKELSRAIDSVFILFVRAQDKGLVVQCAAAVSSLKRWICSDFTDSRCLLLSDDESKLEALGRDRLQKSEDLVIELAGACSHQEDEVSLIDRLDLLTGFVSALCTTSSAYREIEALEVISRLRQQIIFEDMQERDYIELSNLDANPCLLGVHPDLPQPKPTDVSVADNYDTTYASNTKIFSMGTAKCPTGSFKTDVTTYADKYPEDEENLLEEQEKLLDELDSLIGLTQIKKEVKTMLNLAKVQRLRIETGIPNLPVSKHMVFTGNPGTGKTTVARFVGRLYYTAGHLSRGQLIECDRSMLVGGFVGETAIKTKALLRKALGGVLFVDEAYSLLQESDKADDPYGRECIDMIIKFMEDNRDDILVILAGYTTKMPSLLDSNPGLKSRISKIIHFEDFSVAELCEVFIGFAAKMRYTLQESSLAKLHDSLSQVYSLRDPGFGNARTARNLFERAVANHANRVSAYHSPDAEDLRTLLPNDIRIS